MFKLRQHFAVPPPVDVAQTLRMELARVQPRLKPGARIGVAVGSRGISQLRPIVATVLELLKAAGAEPFLLPAMGSHGGATPAGQREILAEYGLTEEGLEVPIHAGMESSPIGVTEEGLEVCTAMEALQADGVVVVNRIKPHTDYDSAVQGSGLLKMLVVGLGKQEGAARFHAAAGQWGHERVIRSAARLVLKTVPILLGVGIVENQVHQPARIAVILAADFERVEAELFAEAKRLMPRLPFDDIDLLIVDRLGKDISGTGMDPNVIGRDIQGYSSALNDASSQRPMVRRLFVRDLTPETHGNAIGVGMADFTTTRLVRAIDRQKTYQNVLTSLSLNGVKIPMHFDTDREAITHALATVPAGEPHGAKVVRIRDTLSLEHLEASQSLADYVGQQAHLEAVSRTGGIEL